MYQARLWPIEPVAKICSGRNPNKKGTQFDSGRREFNSPFYQIQAGVKLLLGFSYVGELDGVKKKINNYESRIVISETAAAILGDIDKNRVEITTQYYT